MVRKLKWGVIGSGGIARRRTIPEGIIPSTNGELTVVYDVDADANADVATEFSATAVDTVESLLEQSDVVYIATPAHLHCEQVLDCARAGRHVLCEKPLGITVCEMEQMITACNSARVHLGTAFMMRFIAQHRAAEQMIQEGRLGKPTYGRAQLSCWYPLMQGAWRQKPNESGGGALMDLGGHCIDLMEMFFGPVRKVSCLVNRTVHSYESEDSAVAVLFFDNGALATIDTFFCIPDNSSKNALELYGSSGSIIARGTIGQGEAGEMVAYLEEEGIGYDAQQTRTASEGIVIDPVPANPYRAEVEAFAQTILDRHRPDNDAQQGIQSQKVLLACYESARTGKVVNVA